ncbi:GNAT family N-acetyltransferase [Parasphingopyxis sp.]|uniref:GNAT family N-acetyltransferase n=1 Tax=Parasphingopyxis sp. TaxID=1920299 RepID=UPI00262CCB7B|nr:GNAT family N-acetyltransferase [Parasphingopyxis sp.]
MGAPTRPVSATDEWKLACTFQTPESLSASIVAQWSVLADQASEPNCFAEGWFLQPSLALLAEPDTVKLAVVTSTSGLLVGLIPLMIETDYGRIPLRHVQNWTHHHSFLDAPLIRRGMEDRFWQILLQSLDETDWATGLLHIRGLPADGRIVRGLERASAALDRPCDVVYRTRRALLRSDKTPDDYWTDTVRKKKRKEMNRLANRLADQGEVRYATLGADEDADPWIGAFLALERQGWKGKNGSAMACEATLAKFFEIVATGAHAAGKLDFHRIDLDGAPIAMLVNFLTAPGGFSYKIAFDERYARYSPGILIERYNLKILERRDIEWLDSCAEEGHSMIDSLWAERRDIVRVSVPLGGRRHRAVFRACRSAEDMASRARGIAGKMKGSDNDGD